MRRRAIYCCHDNIPSVLLEEVAFSGQVTVLLENTKCVKTAAEDVTAMSLPSFLSCSSLPLPSHSSLSLITPFHPSLSSPSSPSSPLYYLAVIA